MILVNTTRGDIKVMVDGALVDLPRITSPSVYDEADVLEDLVIDLEAGSTTLKVSDPLSTGTLFMPEPRDGVLFLVEPEIMLRHPHRTDLVVAAAFEAERSAGELEFFLVEVHRSLPTVGDVPNLSADLLD